MTLVSVGFGMLSAVVGLWSAYGLDVPSGAAIILVQALGFFVALAVGRRSV
jgi:zinc transport system permease protein